MIRHVPSKPTTPARRPPQEVDRVLPCSRSSRLTCKPHQFFAFRASHFDSDRIISPAQRLLSKQTFNLLDIMTPFKRMTSLQSLIILMALPSALGYATSGPMTQPTFMPKIVPSETSPQKYSLGLGRNPPVTNTYQAVLPPEDVQTASQYWMVPEPAVEFPSPLSRQDTSTPQPTHPSRKPKRKTVPLYPKRQSEDVLTISKNGVMSPARSTKLDPNTMWVEMLIHNQQVQLAHATGS